MYGRTAAVAGLLTALVVGGCAANSEPSPASSAGTSDQTGRADRAYQYPPAPQVPTGALERGVADAVVELTGGLAGGRFDQDALNVIAASGDARLAWLVQDVLRFLRGGGEEAALLAAFDRLTGVDPRQDPSFADSSWRSVANHLLAWDLPAPPGYQQAKARIFLLVEPGWAPFFGDENTAIDWRLVTWGGVRMDQRRLRDPEPCRHACIPALDDPALTDAAGGSWYPDDAVVFGLVEGGAALALPKNIMEVHELVNLTLGGRRLGVPYCTLCASAQAYYLDELPDRFGDVVLRTSGLLSRSNKIMYDVRTWSAFDTFTGRAVSGQLHDLGIVLRQATVVTSSWGQWRQAHPDTFIVARDGGIDRIYPLDPLRGRDDAGPIFPVGEIDPRLPAQTQVVGVIADDGTPVAFDAARARAAIGRGQPVVAAGVELVADGGGLRAHTAGTHAPLVSHQAFWFAWSQFHPGTQLWP
ncbi:MAG: DUF3179 domain-containing protein [Sporichthyaceae bacterium]|nr:DUF3179 domain-containing protein [Sporichthyaceae bacterium]